MSHDAAMLLLVMMHASLAAIAISSHLGIIQQLTNAMSVSAVITLNLFSEPSSTQNELRIPNHELIVLLYAVWVMKSRSKLKLWL